MKHIKLSLVLLIAFTISITSCKKEEDATPVKKQLPKGIEGSWIMKAAVFDPYYKNHLDEEIVEYYSTLPSCTQDNTENYKSGGIYTRENGETKCHPEAPEIFDEGTWKVNSDTSYLTTNFTANILSDTFEVEHVWNVLKLKNDSLVLREFFYQDTLYTSYTVTLLRN